MKPSVIRLEGVSPSVKGKVWEVANPLRVGRLPNLEVPLPEPSLSRLHAEIIPTERGWVLRDLGSTNGTFLNGERLGRAEAKLCKYDILQFGEVLLTVTEIRAGERPDSVVVNMTTVAADDGDCWDVLFGGSPDETQHGPAPGELLRYLTQIGRTCKPSDSLNDYLNGVLWRAAEILDAPQGAIYFFGENTDLPHAQAGLALSVNSGREFRISRTVVKQVFDEGRPLLCQINLDEPGTNLRSMVLVPLRVDRTRIGVLALARGADQAPFVERDVKLADALAVTVSPSVVNFARLQDRQEKIMLRTLTVLTQLVQMRDDRTGTHGQRVTDYALLLGKALGVSAEDEYHLRIGTPLHDLGKIGIKDSVLDKPGRLSPEETAHVREQILKGADLLGQLPSLAPLTPIVRNTHERWDGSGYPDGLAGERIPVLARIVAVADAFDSMTSDQPYRPAMPVELALKEIEARAGQQFCPACVQALLRVRGDLEELVAQRRGLTQTMGVDDLRDIMESMSQAASPAARVLGAPPASGRAPTRTA
jgi:HD-GYP domain-containing protein (c-di-GMP phosphodiesterase class II)/pSer/pThr/pTyr-binding forkhead associated (FHA) protein